MAGVELILGKDTEPWPLEGRHRRIGRAGHLPLETNDAPERSHDPEPRGH